MGTKTWTATIDGAEVLVTNHFSLLKWDSWESLHINGELIQRQSGSQLFTMAYLRSPMQTTSGNRTLEVLIGQAGFSAACHILVDGELVGGDVHLKLNIPSPEEWTTLKAAGIAKFIFLRGIVYLGLPFALAMLFVTAGQAKSVTQSLASFTFYLLSFGGSMGYLHWRSLSKQFEKLE